MTPATQPPHVDEHHGAAMGPGRLLRTAREGANISLREVSAQMHLDERTMLALENDSFDELPAPTFVRGYLRGYARLLGVPVGPVMEAYDREGFKPPDLVADIAEKPQASSGDFPVRMTTYVVVLVLTALVVVWWRNQGFDEPMQAQAPAPVATTEVPALAARPDPAPLAPAGTGPGTEATGASAAATGESRAPAAAASTAAAAPPAPAGSAPGAAPATGTAAAPRAAPAAASAREPATAGAGAPAPRVEEVITQAQRVLERTRGRLDAAESGAAAAPVAGAAAAQAGAGATPGASAPPSAVAATPAPGATAVPPTPAASPAPGSPSGQPAAATAPAPEAQPGTAGAGNARLTLRFPEEAWVEIYDRDDRRLFYNLVTPGRELDLTGPPPLRVLLGRTRGVVVQYNGAAVDLAPHTERGVARFTLGE